MRASPLSSAGPPGGVWPRRSKGGRRLRASPLSSAGPQVVSGAVALRVGPLVPPGLVVSSLGPPFRLFYRFVSPGWYVPIGLLARCGRLLLHVPRCCMWCSGGCSGQLYSHSLCVQPLGSRRTQDLRESPPVRCCWFLPWSRFLFVLIPLLRPRGDLRLTDGEGLSRPSVSGGVFSPWLPVVCVSVGGILCSGEARRSGWVASGVPYSVGPVGVLQQRGTAASGSGRRETSGNSGVLGSPSR